MASRHTRHVAVYALILFASGALVAAIDWKPASAISSIATNERPSAEKFGPLVKHWSNRIEEVGAIAAQHEMRSTGETLPLSKRHFLAHSFGQALFDTGGITHFSICNGVFNYGCEHQMMGLQSSEHGASGITELKESCDRTKSINKCAHGIGHALTATYGYEPEDLAITLAACDALYQDNVGSISCLEGAFMEYNLREVAKAENQYQLREYNPNNPYTPCQSVDQAFQPACVFELPQWWRKATFKTHTTPKETFAYIGTLCRSLPKGMSEFTPACFLGIGYTASFAGNFSPNAIKELCAAGGTTYSEHLWCLSEAARRFKVSDTNMPAPCDTFFADDENSQKWCEIFSSTTDRKQQLQVAITLR